MSSGNEVARGNQWVHTTLANDSTLATLAPGGVWRNIAPEYDPNNATATLPTPFIVFGWQGGVDTNTATAQRLISRNLWRIEAIGPTEHYAAIAQAADRIDALVSLVRNSTGSDYYMLACYRESPLDRDEMVDGIQWSHVGGLYRLILQMQ